MSPSPVSQSPEFVAKHRFARITARKARRIADLIRGRSVNEALELLTFAPQRGASFYLIEVNDNPSIEAGCEDKIIGDKLYLRVMQSLLRRIKEIKGV